MGRCRVASTNYVWPPLPRSRDLSRYRFWAEGPVRPSVALPNSGLCLSLGLSRIAHCHRPAPLCSPFGDERPWTHATTLTLYLNFPLHSRLRGSHLQGPNRGCLGHTFLGIGIGWVSVGGASGARQSIRLGYKVRRVAALFVFTMFMLSSRDKTPWPQILLNNKWACLLHV